MTPVGFNTNAYASAYGGMRPEHLMRKSVADPGRQVGEQVELPSPSVSAPSQPQAPFENVLGTFVKEVNGKQMAAADKVTGLLSGQNVPLHQAMIAMEEASVSFQLMVEVRNKLLEGYQELMRLQV